MELFSQLPKDVIHNILVFYGKIKYRSGKYINILSPDDERYVILSRIPIPRPVVYKVHYQRQFTEHFENKLIFSNRKYEMIIWNVYNPPDRIMYFLYKPYQPSYSELWHRL
jgi:hypothetical protein